MKGEAHGFMESRSYRRRNKRGKCGNRKELARKVGVKAVEVESEEGSGEGAEQERRKVAGGVTAGGI